MSKSDLLLENSNFHQLRKFERIEQHLKAREEAKRKLKLMKSLDSDNLFGYDEQQAKKHNESDYFNMQEGTSPMLSQIEEDEELVA